MNILDQVDIELMDNKQPQRIWSPLQGAIFQAINQQPDNLLIQAVAGSGKTTTIIEGMGYASGRSLFLAFNKAIAMDIAGRAPSGDVKTLNALGHRLWKENCPGAELNARKAQDLLKKLMGDTQDFKDHGYMLARLIGLAKNSGFGISDDYFPEDFVALMDAYLDIPFEDQSRLAAVTCEAFTQSILDFQTFDFDDQVYMGVKENWEFPEYSNVFVDECQDLSPIQHMMLDRLQARGARIIAVGDRHQAIYGFRGASHDSMDVLKTRFQMLELPLSVTYRCPQLVVALAQDYCPTIQARPGAPEGLLLYREDDPDLWTEGLVVCRNNAPLFAAILRHVRAKKPCRVLSNFMDSFQGFIRGFKTTYTSDLRAKLDRWFEREKEAAERKNQRGKLYALRDKYDTIKLLCSDYSRTEDVIAMVKRLGEGQSGPTFATIHKAKGLEHEHVYILRPDLMPAFYATTPEQRQQEANLTYVAITRAKETLTFGVSQK